MKVVAEFCTGQKNNNLIDKGGYLVMELDMYTDGAARNNPGPAGVGVVILDSSGNVKKELNRYIGETTNNVAEYKAIIAGLKAAKTFAPSGINIFADSQLVIKQLLGEYKVKSERLRPLYDQCIKLLNQFSDYNLQHIPREDNEKADRLANLGIDQVEQNRDEAKSNPQQFVRELKQEIKDFEISPDLLPIVKEIQKQVDISHVDKEDSFKKGIIFGLLLTDKLN